MGKSKVIAPKGLLIDVRSQKRAIGNALNGAAKGVKVDFGVTTRTWDHRPEFAISSPSAFEREVSTDDAVYGMLDEGTKAHDIEVKNAPFLRFKWRGFRSKTVPNDIRSRKGAQGKLWAQKKIVHHPGTKPRNWTKVIKRKWDRQLPVLLQRAIDSTVKG